MRFSEHWIKFAKQTQAALMATVCPVPLHMDVLREADYVYLIGNGGSASIASHIANDLMKAQGIRANTLTDPALFTCFANDYGYDHAYERMLAPLLNNKCLVICISSSGRSHNICRAARLAADICQVATFTGFDPDNPLRGMGHYNYWVPSNNYGVVESAHLMLLHSIANPGE